MPGVSMKRLLLVSLALAAALALPGHARAIDQCGLPTDKPLWIDFGDGSVPFWGTFARPGNVVAASNLVYPPKIREAGAKTVYFDLYLNKRVGTPSAPKEADTIVGRANTLFDIAAQSSGCDKPVIALNELFGSGLETPWSATNTRYRANVLTFLRTLASRGARPLLLLSSLPYTGSAEAADWWREAAKYADLVPEVYFNGPNIHKRGALLGSRRMRVAMRKSIVSLASLGIPPDRIGIMLGFQTAHGAGGREGLQPAAAWFELVKWQALAARQVARETGIATIWSWGWAVWSSAANDPDKAASACVYLWTREPSLCDGPGAAGPGFNASLTDGQIALPPGARCTFGDLAIRDGELRALERLTGDREIAYTVLLARVAESGSASIPSARVLAAERAVIALRFGGSRGAYLAALARANATVAAARAILVDELRRTEIERRLRAPSPSVGETTTFYLSYPELVARPVEVKPAPWWLGGLVRGLALAPLAPQELFQIPTGRLATVRALDGSYAVRALGDPQPLGSIPLAEARPAISSALAAFARRGAFERWTEARQNAALNTAVCARDDLPAPGAVRLTGYLPFLSLTG
ncbi:MAG: hypothetical protein H0V40_01465 [Actinobacteria bacterium]|nr:hypothetical protein [Actinomycetota bacterium]